MMIVQLIKGKQESIEFLALNPRGKVPVATFPDGFTLYAGRAICKYLTNKYGFALLPPSLNLEAMARFDQAKSEEAAYFADPAGELSFELFAKKFFLKLLSDGAVVANAKEALRSCFDVQHRALQRRDNMAGNVFTLVDIYYKPLVQRLFQCGLGDMVTSRSSLSAWWTRCTVRPGIKSMLTVDRGAWYRRQPDRNEPCSDSEPW